MRRGQAHFSLGIWCTKLPAEQFRPVAQAEVEIFPDNWVWKKLDREDLFKVDDVSSLTIDPDCLLYHCRIEAFLTTEAVPFERLLLSIPTQFVGR